MVVQVKDVKIGHNQPVRIMGVVNLSQESFYGESAVSDEDSLISLIRTHEKGGADIIDVGAASTSPKSVYSRTEISRKEEFQRISTFIEIIVENTKLPISIDTSSSDVAELALDSGASLVNDISGLHGDKKMAKLVSERDAPIVLMANCGDPCQSIDQSLNALRGSLKIASGDGIGEERIIIDPGIGFGKPTETDLNHLRELRNFTRLGYPILVGVSRKAFIGDVLSIPDPSGRLIGTIAATALAVANGADVIRAHDAMEAVSAAKISRSIERGKDLEFDDVHLIRIQNEREAQVILENIGVGAKIRPALARKAIALSILVKDIKVPAALIIKQEMLALGGDAAYHHDTIDFARKTTDILIMGTKTQLIRLGERLKLMDYYSLDRIGSAVERLLEIHGEN